MSSSKGPPPIYCTETDCDYKTPRDTWDMMKKHMEVHTVNVHPPPSETHVCEVCAKKFNNKHALKKHSHIHEDKKKIEDRRKYPCVVCGKTFVTSYNLKLHEVVHTGKKNYECKVCNKKFPRADNLKRHMMIHTDERPYLCSLCSKSFTQSAHLKEHSMLHSDETFSCDICSKVYSQPQTLRRHRMTHTSSPFRCPECGYSSTRAYILTDHINKQHRKGCLRPRWACLPSSYQAKIQLYCGPYGPTASIFYRIWRKQSGAMVFTLNFDKVLLKKRFPTMNI